MCQACETKPVYEFTNKRKLCRRCFINWFQKKVLYTIRKFGMIVQGDVIGYKKGTGFREVVLEEVLKMFSDNYGVEIVKLPTLKRANIKTALPTTIDSSANKIIHELIKGDVKNIKESAPVSSRGKIIKPLYLFLDAEVKLYAKLKRLKHKKVNVRKGKINSFIEGLEKKHPEVKRAVVNGWLEIN